MNIKSNMRPFNSWEHYENTKKHIFGKSAKNEKIDYKIVILKESSEKPKTLNNIYHVVGEIFPTSDTSNLSDEEMINALKKYFLFWLTEYNLKILDATIVYGENKPGEIHLIIEMN